MLVELGYNPVSRDLAEARNCPTAFYTPCVTIPLDSGQCIGKNWGSTLNLALDVLNPYLGEEKRSFTQIKAFPSR